VLIKAIGQHFFHTVEDDSLLKQAFEILEKDY